MHPQAPDLARRRLLALASALLVTSGSTKSAESKHPPVRVFVDAVLARYGFPHGHPLGIDRQAAFMREATAQGLLDKVERAPSRVASTDELRAFIPLTISRKSRPPKNEVASCWMAAIRRSFQAFLTPLQRSLAPRLRA